MTRQTRLQELSPETVAHRLREQSIVLVDVREAQEYAAEHIPGAVLHPLSTFDPASLPSSEAGELVFQCGSGKRSAMAVQHCLAKNRPHATHMAGGIQAWKASGLSTRKA